MRPVDKGNAPRTYSKYQDAREDLIERIGCYCSYCEMPIKNMPEVEHVVSINRGGSVIDWGNFLLSCRYCNINKGTYNSSRASYFWADEDNTFCAFKYTRGRPIEPNLHNLVMIDIAKRTIELCKLNREPGSANPPTENDRRWRSRNEAWNVAIQSFDGWTSVPVDSPLRNRFLEQIARTAVGQGHFSIWMEVFKGEVEVRRKLIDAFVGTAKECFDSETQTIRRVGGKI